MEATKKILIVDDEPDTVTFIGTWLTDHGYAICTAGDGEEGLRVLVSDRPDLVLMDLKMPNQTGLQMYRRMQRDEELRRIPVIFVTGMTELEIYDAGCAPMPRPAARLEKPVDLAALRAAIARALP